MYILIISRIQFFREMLAVALQAGSDIITVSELSSETLDSFAEKHVPTLVVVDSSHPEGFALISAIRARFPAVRVVVLAVYHSDEVFLAWADMGIFGYVEPDSSTDKLVATIRKAAAGDVVCSPRLTGLLLNRSTSQSNAGPASARLHGLTGREREVLELLADGLSNKRISRRLRIAESTVKNHIHSILQKMDVRSRGEAAAYFRQSSQEYAPHRWSENVRPVGSLLRRSRAAPAALTNRRSDGPARTAP